MQNVRIVFAGSVKFNKSTSILFGGKIAMDNSVDVFSVVTEEINN